MFTSHFYFIGLVVFFFTFFLGNESKNLNQKLQPVPHENQNCSMKAVTGLQGTIQKETRAWGWGPHMGSDEGTRTGHLRKLKIIEKGMMRSGTSRKLNPKPKIMTHLLFTKMAMTRINSIF